jgi:hypothetical protein
MIKWDTVQSALEAWAVTAGLPILWAGQSTDPTQPRRPYATLQVVAVDKYGFDGVHDTVIDATTNQAAMISKTIYGQRKLVLTVQVFAFDNGMQGQGAVAFCQALKDRLEIDSVWQALDQAGLALVNHAETKNLAEAMGQQFIGRAAFDVTFGAAAYLCDAMRVATVGAVEISGEIDFPPPGGVFEVDRITDINTEAPQ